MNLMHDLLGSIVCMVVRFRALIPHRIISNSTAVIRRPAAEPVFAEEVALFHTGLGNQATLASEEAICRPLGRVWDVAC
jgi:hypothetical protein